MGIEAQGAGVVYAGIDEAGYGPMLGPLCVGMAVFRVRREPDSAMKAPDLWRLLRSVVCRGGRIDRRGRIPVDDSKRLKQANEWTKAAEEKREAAARRGADDAADGHALARLEPGVLCFSACCGGALARDDEDLLTRLGARLEERPWYAGPPAPLPLTATADRLAVRANALSAALAGAGVEVLGLHARAVGETEFNDGCERWGSKAAVNWSAASALMGEVWERWAGDEGAWPGGARVAIDRHGGRVSYGEALASSIRGGRVETMEERPRASRYRITGAGSDGREREMTVIVQPEAESAHLPVALASMTAKLVRELAMRRLNRYFAALDPALKPTAGYRGDAQRWLRDAAALISDEDRRVLVRRQ